MAELAVAAPAGPAVKPPKKKAPGAAELLLRAVAASRDRKGISFFALKKELTAQGYDVENHKHCVISALHHLLDSKAIVNTTKGVGAIGSYKLNKDAPKGEKVAEKLPAAHKPAATKKTKAATHRKAKKPAAAETTPANKSAKSPKKKAAAPEESVKAAKK